MRIIYLSGAYRSKWGLIGTLINIWKARRVAQRLWKQGWVVICPHLNTALFDSNDKIPYLQGDLEIITRCCDALYMMKNWYKSVGSNVEHRVAVELGLQIVYACDYYEKKGGDD